MNNFVDPFHRQRPRAERAAITRVVSAGESLGYGNMIQVLQEAWRQKLIANGMSEDGADYGSGFVCSQCNLDRRTGERYKRKDVK